MIAAAAGSATAEAVLTFDSSPAKPWPSFEDGLLVLWCCDQPIHRERKAMQVALRSGPVMAVRWLLSARADVEQPVEGDLTPLRLAARFGSEELIEMLLEGSANPNSRGRFGNTALMVAAMHGHHNIVELLLSKGSQVNTNGDGETAIDLACRYPDVADLLTRHVSQYGWTGARPMERVRSQGGFPSPFALAFIASSVGGGALHCRPFAWLPSSPTRCTWVSMRTGKSGRRIWEFAKTNGPNIQSEC